MKTGPCAKQRVIATIVAPNGVRVTGENDCFNPQPTCPREGLPTGHGYELCASICQQRGHAEINALRIAGPLGLTHGSTLYLEGHTYVCSDCKAAAAAAGIKDIVIGSPPQP